MKSFTIFAIFSIFLVSETLGFFSSFGASSSSEEDGHGFVTNRRCISVGTTVDITRVDGSSESCICHAPTTTTTTSTTPPTKTTSGRHARPRPTHSPPPPRPTWACTSTPATTSAPTTASPSTTTPAR